MPVFKIKNKDGSWQEVAGVSGHSHSVSQIVDFPDMSGFATEEYVDSKIGIKSGIYVGETEPADAVDGDIWINTNETVATSASKIHVVDAGASEDLSSIDFSGYAVGDIILVTMSS